MDSGPCTRVHTRNGTRHTIVLLALICGACEGLRELPPLVTEKDSAGVVVMENRGNLDSWPIIAEIGAPDLTIGAVDGPSQYTFGHVSDIRSMPDGGLVVADVHDLTLRVFRQEGRHNVTIGRRGEGPGEFGFLTIAGIDTDGIWAWDAMRQRITRFSLQGDLLDVVRISPSGAGTVSELRRLPDGSYVGRSRYSASGSGDLELTSLKLVTDSLALLRIDPQGTVNDTVAVVPAEEQLREVWAEADGAQRGFGAARPFGAATFWVVHEDGGVTTLRSTHLELVRRDGAGRVRMVARLPSPHRPLDPAQVERLRQHHLRGAGNDPQMRALVARAFDDSTLPDAPPLASTLKLDVEGNYWIAEFRTFPDEVSQWIVVAPSGALLGRVSLPQGFMPHEIGRTRITGLVRDAFDVQFVHRYPLAWRQ
jgi:hypothetical protein